MSETTALLFDLILWCQIIALMLNIGIIVWLLLERRHEKKGVKRWKTESHSEFRSGKKRT